MRRDGMRGRDRPSLHCLGFFLHFFEVVCPTLDPCGHSQSLQEKALLGTSAEPHHLVQGNSTCHLSERSYEDL